MGYECPVCGSEEADGEHLANHLAFVALTRGGDHGAWLDEHAPDWGQRDPEALAEEVTPHATETDAEPGTGSHDQEVPVESPAAAERGGDLSGEAAEILEEAQELTREMYGADAGGEAGNEGDASGRDGETADDASGDDGRAAGDGDANDGPDDSESE